MIEIIRYSTEEAWLAERAKDITSTEVSALFGVSPYMTMFELWHVKAGKHQVQFKPTERTIWGQRLQNAIAAGIAEEQSWNIAPMTEYIRNKSIRMGASFDFEIISDGILEIKNVDAIQFREGWIVDGDDIEAPPHIELQVQHQLALSHKKFAYIGALVGGNRVALIKREPDGKVIAEIEKRVSEFWFSVGTGKPPAPDFKVDAKFIAKLYKFSEPGKIADVRGIEKFTSLALQYKALGDAAKEIDSQRDAIKAELLMAIGDAEKVTGDGFSITAGMVGPCRMEYDRAGYRQFRFNWPRKKGVV